MLCKVIAPIIIPTMSRYEHFVRLMESLKNNTWAKYTDVYIGLDYPPYEKYFDGYNKIKEYLSGNFEEFNKIVVFEREKNYGAYKNCECLRNYIFQRYDRLIRADDDCEFSSVFLEYMNKALTKFENDDNVVAVTGYSYPVTWKVDKNATAFKNNAIFPMWGTGYLRKNYYKMENDILNDCFSNFFRKNFIKRENMTKARWIDVIGSLYNNNKLDLLHRTTDISFGAYIQIKEKYIITPKETLVINHGFDGSGIYCQNNSGNSRYEDSASTYNYKYQTMQYLDKFTLVVDKNQNLKTNRIIMDKFDNRSILILFKTFIKYILLKFKNILKKY